MSQFEIGLDDGIVYDQAPYNPVICIDHGRSSIGDLGNCRACEFVQCEGYHLFFHLFPEEAEFSRVRLNVMKARAKNLDKRIHVDREGHFCLTNEDGTLFVPGKDRPNEREQLH